jgi:hypothetical protein
MKRQKTNFSFSSLFMAVGCWLLVMGCSSSSPKDAVLSGEWPLIYPDYVGVTVPYDIAPLNFSMLSDSVSAIDVEVTGGKGGSVHSNGKYADFDTDEWRRLLASNRGDSLTVTVCARQDGRWTRYRDFSVYVSTDSIGAWGITYRRIAPGYEQYGLMGLYQRCLSNFDETPLIENTLSPGTCLNCHTANRTNPDQYVFHARGDHGGTVMHNTNLNPQISNLKSQISDLSMVYPYWHPGGRYVAFSTNKTSQMFHFSGPKRIEVYDSSSDVYIYDTETRTALTDTLIMRKYWAENTPAFSPDGHWLYFTTARRQVYPTDYDKERYSLCRVSFDDATGSLGQTVDTLISADQIGKSVTWPRLSYDGRYLMYTQADYGYFSIWHPEADLWLLDLHTGASRPLDEVNSDRSDSFHNWSPDSRWFLFTSRRDDGLYTRIYFASIDDTGRATKPFMLPQRNPKAYYQLLLHSYNTPDFTSRRVETDSSELSEILFGK